MRAQLFARRRYQPLDKHVNPIEFFAAFEEIMLAHGAERAHPPPGPHTHTRT